MANTLKFGNGQWATKYGSTLAYNDENGNFKPLPFTFERRGNATRVNKEGLIEVVGENIPRIDYLNDSNGALKLEPSRTNLLQYSEDFSNAAWQKNSVGSASAPIVTSNFAISPNGIENASRVQFEISGSTSSDRSSLETVLALNGSSSYTLSFYIKSNTGVNQNLSVWLNSVYGDNITVTNEWVRVVQTFSSNSTFNRGFGLAASGNIQQSVDVLIWGASLEEGSYATSYIPTQGGSAVTRLAESCEQNLSNQVSLTEGVFYVDVTNLGRTQNANILTQNSTSNSVYGYIQTNNRIVFGLFANSVSVPITSSLEYEIGTRTKIAFHYKSGNSKLYVNGSLVGNSTDTFTLGSSFCDSIRLIDNASAYFAFPEKSILQEFKIYNTALTDQELAALTQV